MSDESNMKILALEFSSTRRSVAVAEQTDSGVVIRGTAQEIGQRETRAFSLIEAALREASFPRDSIDYLAVGLGPGSYTGIRVAISLAQGWQLARHVRVIGLSSVESLAEQARAGGINGEVNIVIDAQRNEFYLANYQVSGKAALLKERLQIVSAAEVNRRIASNEIVIGPDLKEAVAEAREVWPDASTLARLATGREDFVDGSQLEPIYLRPIAFVKAPVARGPSR